MHGNILQLLYPNFFEWGKIMNKSKFKLMLTSLIFLFGIIISTSVLASNEDIQILKQSEKEYMIYISEHLNTSFEFAFTNEKEADEKISGYK